jgi:hypothetical protein
VNSILVRFHCSTLHSHLEACKLVEFILNLLVLIFLPYMSDCKFQRLKSKKCHLLSREYSCFRIFPPSISQIPTFCIITGPWVVLSRQNAYKPKNPTDSHWLSYTICVLKHFKAYFAQVCVLHLPPMDSQFCNLSHTLHCHLLEDELFIIRNKKHHTQNAISGPHGLFLNSSCVTSEWTTVTYWWQ